jgi:translocator protein
MLLLQSSYPNRKTSMNETATWYASQIQPFFAPPAWVFGPVWAVLYAIIAASFGYVLVQAIKKKWSWAVFLPFGLNLLFNLAFSPIQFGLKNNFLAAIDIVLVLATLLWALRSVWGRARWVALVNIPYLLWVSFATVLQLSITWLNR